VHLCRRFADHALSFINGFTKGISGRANFIDETLTKLLARMYKEWSRHNSAQLGASLSYYAVLSLAPLVVALVGAIGLTSGPEAARGGLQSQLQQFMRSEAADAVEHVVAAASSLTSGIIATMLGLLTLLLGASDVAMPCNRASTRFGTCLRARPSAGGDRMCDRNLWGLRRYSPPDS
jgi:hypothetical protein